MSIVTPDFSFSRLNEKINKSPFNRRNWNNLAEASSRFIANFMEIRKKNSWLEVIIERLGERVAIDRPMQKAIIGVVNRRRGGIGAL